jgi:hypothetical protein
MYIRYTKVYPLQIENQSALPQMHRIEASAMVDCSNFIVDSTTVSPADALSEDARN